MDTDQHELDRRFELDARALALKFATEQVRFAFDKDKPPVHETTLEAARAYYDFLSTPPYSPPQDMRNNLVRRDDGS